MEEIENNELIEVPFDQIAPETLNALVEAFVLREGTEYGPEDVPLETKTRQVHRQIESNRVKIVFDPREESITFLTEEELKRRRRSPVGS